MKRYDQIHETAVKEILDLFDAVSDAVEDGWNPKDIASKILGNHKNNNYYNSTSIAKATSDMTLVFPVICSKAVPIETASMITKAIERKCVTMLQLLFSAYQISDKSQAIDYVKQFHGNLDTRSVGAEDLFSILKLMDIDEVAINPNTEKVIREDLIRNTDYYLPNTLSEASINQFGVYDSCYKTPRIVMEAKPNRPGIEEIITKTITDLFDKERAKDAITANDILNKQRKENERSLDRLQNIYNKEDKRNNKRFERDKEENERRYKRNRENEMRDRMSIGKDVSDLKNYTDVINKQIAASEIKKANELMPTPLIVNYKYVDKDKDGVAIVDMKAIVIGVKAKLYYVDSSDVVMRLINKTKDKNWITQFIRGTTREISFWKDFVLAIDRAKIDALALSNKGNSSKMWKALERRAANGKVRRAVGNGSAGGVSAISNLVISQEEVELLKRTYGIDIERLNIVRSIMEGYNFLSMCIADDTLEVAKFLFDDNDPSWESVSYNHLEREAADNAYKKVVNMMTKVAR